MFMFMLLTDKKKYCWKLRLNMSIFENEKDKLEDANEKLSQDVHQHIQSSGDTTDLCDTTD